MNVPAAPQADTKASAAGGSTGIKECDAYIAKWNACYKDPTVRAAMQGSFDAMKKGWATSAHNPQLKAATAKSCQMLLDAFPAASCK